MRTSRKRRKKAYLPAQVEDSTRPGKTSQGVLEIYKITVPFEEVILINVV